MSTDEEVWKRVKSIGHHPPPVGRREHQHVPPTNNTSKLEAVVVLLLCGMIMFEVFSVLCWCIPCALLLEPDDPICQMMDYMPFSIQFMYKGWAVLPESWYGMFFFATFGTAVYLNTL